jgi:hypothetical protein
MNTQLYIVKGKSSRDYYARRSIRFAIVDADTKKTYPSNFICMLPQHVNMTSDDSSVFSKTFSGDRVELAKNLLTAALEVESDLEIKKEIQDRLKMLTPKPAWQPRNRF